MSNKIEHIGIAVKDLKKSEELFQKLLGEGPYKREEVYSEGVTTSFFKVGQQKIELLKGYVLWLLKKHYFCQPISIKEVKKKR